MYRLRNNVGLTKPLPSLSLCITRPPPARCLSKPSRVPEVKTGARRPGFSIVYAVLNIPDNHRGGTSRSESIETKNSERLPAMIAG